MFYRFDIDKWVIHMMPPVLRKKSMYAFLRVLVFPIKQLVSAFLTYKDSIDKQLTYNSFTNYLERFLNGLFFFDDGVIYITEERFEGQVFLSFANEQADPVYVSMRSEDPASPLWLSSISPDLIYGTFIVHVPSVLSEADRSIIFNWVNYYRMAGTEFSIEVYHG